jgi:hypothetical protein
MKSSVATVPFSMHLLVTMRKVNLTLSVKETAYNNPASLLIVNLQSIGLAVRVPRYTNLLGDRRRRNSKDEIEYNKANSAQLLQ